MHYPPDSASRMDSLTNIHFFFFFTPMPRIECTVADKDQ